MRSWTETHHEGEFLGPVDWSYDFLSHFQSMGSPEETKREYCDKAVARLKEMSEGGEWMFSPSDFSAFKVVHVGMYDGWPYWRPTPAIAYIGPLNSLEWAFFDKLAWSKPYRTPPPASEATKGQP